MNPRMYEIIEQIENNLKILNKHYERIMALYNEYLELYKKEKQK
jgi:hypothetical protein